MGVGVLESKYLGGNYRYQGNMSLDRERFSQRGFWFPYRVQFDLHFDSYFSLC